jgi:hypothetical protein
MTQMKKQNRQIIILINVVTQLVLFIAKLKLKLIVMFSFSDDFTFTNTQRVSNIRVVKLTKRAQIIRIETIKIQRTKIHEKSIEFLISLNFETTHFEQKDALFVNKHISLQSNHFNLDTFINVVSIMNLSISNQSFFESLVVDVLDLTHDLVSVFVSVSVSTSETELISTHQ